MHPRRFAPGVMLCAVAACVGGEQRGAPLYPGSPRARYTIALLIGPITRVDGRTVPSQGNTFELLPGCHIVEIGGSEGAFSPQYGGWAVSFPHLTYAFEMRADRTYIIEFEPDPAIGRAPNGSGRVVAREYDADGHNSVLPIARNSADIARCRHQTGTR